MLHMHTHSVDVRHGHRDHHAMFYQKKQKENRMVSINGAPTWGKPDLAAQGDSTAIGNTPGRPRPAPPASSHHEIPQGSTKLAAGAARARMLRFSAQVPTKQTTATLEQPPISPSTPSPIDNGAAPISSSGSDSADKAKLLGRMRAAADFILAKFEENTTPLPKNLLHIWVGPKPLPGEFAKNINAFHDMNKDNGFSSHLFSDSTKKPSKLKSALAWTGSQARLGKDIQRIDVATDSRLADFRAGPLHPIYKDALNNGRFAQAADVLRYAVLNSFGGVYADVDDFPLVPIKVDAPKLGILTTHHLKQPDGNYAISNSPIFAVPNNPVLKLTMHNLPEACKKTAESPDANAILQATGPYLFTSAVEEIYPFMRESAPLSEHRKTLKLPQEDMNDQILNGALELARSDVRRGGLFVHLGHAGSWKT